MVFLGPVKEKTLHLEARRLGDSKAKRLKDLKASKAFKYQGTQYNVILSVYSLIPIMISCVCRGRLGHPARRVAYLSQMYLTQRRRVSVDLASASLRLLLIVSRI